MKFDTHKYMHGYCQYFAIEAAKLFNGKVVLWLDKDEINDKTVLCHAYCEIIKGLYIDALGTFSDISEREEEFEFNYKMIDTYSIDEAKETFKQLKIPFTNVEDKKEAREFLRNNMAVVELNIKSSGVRPVGIYAKNESCESLLFLSYMKQENKFLPLIHGLGWSYFVKNIKSHEGFKYCKNWYRKF